MADVVTGHDTTVLTIEVESGTRPCPVGQTRKLTLPELLILQGILASVPNVTGSCLFAAFNDGECEYCCKFGGCPIDQANELS